MSQVSVFSKVFPIQSYFDDTALHTALKQQAMNELIVEKKIEPHITGRVIGNYPASQTPVAVRFMTSGGKGGTTPVFLAPGQFVQTEGFRGIEWGLPLGWRGGGVASVLVGDGPDAFVGWSAQKAEVLIHRVRLPIIADVDPTLPVAGGGPVFRRSWPTRFPWPASQNAVGFAPEITRVVMRLRNTALAASADMRILIKQNDDFDIDSTGLTVTSTDYSYIDVTWPEAPVGIVGVAYPIIEISPPKIGGDDAVIALLDVSGAGAGGPLVGDFVDIMKYGRI